MEKLSAMDSIEARGFTRFYSSKEGSIEKSYKFISPKLTSGCILKAQTNYPLVVGSQRIETNSKVSLVFLKNTYDSLDEVSKIAEVQLMKRLPPHPNILKMYEVIYDAPSKKVAVVFENTAPDLYTTNCDRPDNETLLESRAQTYIFHLLLAIKHMHDNGIVHGNITSRNVLVSKGLKLLPLSSQKLENAELSNYSAPEMIVNKADSNHKVDIWAAG